MSKKPEMIEKPAYVVLNAEGEPVYWLHALLWPAEFGYPLWSQRDPEWAGEQLGFGSATIGQYGCLITSIAMALTNIYDQRITPAHVNNEMKRLKAYSGYNRNELDLTAVSKAWNSMQYLGSAKYPLDPAPAAELAKWVKQGDVVIIQIDMDLSDPDVDEHWVLLVDAKEDGSQFTYHDAWPKKEEQDVFTMPPGYCKRGWTPTRAITAHVRYGVVR